ncbi:hypothetical protein C6P45_002830 [Maudiozyma exigua]|uniref:Uncharacterized protein n=1 Tax=Maudiozyma exigua TaxID=34358 RepID=A0A9P7B387_MAUEX|nr:hypothetical protein C6P45_002830 [Kazachstania exigua]
MFTSMTLPSGQVVTDFTGYIYLSYDGFECGVGNSTSSILSEWTGTYATTYSTDIVSNEGTGVPIGGIPYTEVETIYYILTPAAISSSSSTIESSSEILTSSSSLSEYSSDTFSSSSSSSEESPYNSSAPPSSSSEELSSVQTSRTSSEISSTLVSSDSVESSEGKTSLSNIVTSSENDISGMSDSSSQDKDTSTTGLSETSLSKNLDISTDVASSVSTVSIGFTNSSTTDHSESRSTDFASTTSTQPSSSIIKSKENTEFNNDDSILTSTYTDIFGLTRTITLKYGDHNIVESGTTITNHNEASKTNQNAGIPKESHSIMTLVGQNGDSYTIVQIQSGGTSTSASVNIQPAPNVATRYTVGLLISVISLTFQLFFI